MAKSEHKNSKQLRTHGKFLNKNDSRKNHKRSKAILPYSSSDEGNDFTFDRSEVVRLTGELLLKSESLGKEMRRLYKKLDSKESVILEGLEDKSLKKKLRHIFQALRLEKKESNGQQGYRKPKNCSIKLVKIYDQVLHEAKEVIKSHHVIVPKQIEISKDTNNDKDYDEKISSTNQVESEYRPSQVHNYASSQVGPTMPTIEDLEEARELIEGNSLQNEVKNNEMVLKREPWMIESPDILDGIFNTKKRKREEKIDRFKVREREDEERKMLEFMNEYNKQFRSKSLLEMYQEGTFSKFKDEQKEYISSHQYGVNDPYNKTGLKTKSKNDSGAWRTFDRETDLEIGRQIKAQDFHRFLDQSKDLSQRFGKGKFQSSFL